MIYRIIMVWCLSILTLGGCAQSPSNQSTDTTSTHKTMSEAEWKQRLTPEQYFILREKGTDRPYSGKFVFTKDHGVYSCAGCGTALFTHQMKFDSHCGWPSFDKEIAGGKIKQTRDTSHGMERVEITCANCGGHLGHLFDDGPTATGLRYCVNSTSLTFEPATLNNGVLSMDTAIFAGGCFWCIEAAFESLKGVKSVVSGYSGGQTPHPDYVTVSSGNSGYAEVVQVIFDPSIISFTSLLEVFFTIHDPTTLNQQGADIGSQYRSAIFYTNLSQQQQALQAIKALTDNKVYSKPIVTEVVAFSTFYKAEDMHQAYYNLSKNEPYCRIVIQPKLDKLKKVFADKLKTDK